MCSIYHALEQQSYVPLKIKQMEDELKQRKGHIFIDISFHLQD
jgi:hypothetical protein